MRWWLRVERDLGQTEHGVVEHATNTADCGSFSARTTAKCSRTFSGSGTRYRRVEEGVDAAVLET